MRRRDILTAAAAAGWPLPLSAQQNAAPVIGFLSNGNEKRGLFPTVFPEFRRGLAEAGYVEGKNLTIELRFSDGFYDRLPALAADLVGRKVHLIATMGGNGPALAAKGASQTVPIVFESGDDPIEAGLIASLARPGGNATGVLNLFVELVPKLFDLLGEIVPSATGFGLLVNPGNRSAERAIKDAEEAAAAKRVKLAVLKAATVGELDVAFASFDQLKVGALVIVADALFVLERLKIAALADRYAVPTIDSFRAGAVAGGLMSYGANVDAVYHQVGAYAGKILRGAKPADLPVQQPTQFELIVNMKTAKALGLAIPPSILARADEVIE